MKKILYITFLYSILLSKLNFAQDVREDWTVKYDMNDSNYIADIVVRNDENIYILVTSKFQDSER